MKPATPENLAAAGVDIEHHWIPDLYSKRVKVPAGASLAQHIHPYDHASALVSGTALVEVDGVGLEFTGPTMLMIRAGKEHRITALTDLVWHCIHITDDHDPETVDKTILRG